MIVEADIEHVRPNEWNPNSMTAGMKAALKANIERVGFVQPILVRDLDDGYEIVDGEHRYQAAVELGYKTVPVIFVDATDGEARAQTIAMNRLRGTMEPADLARLIREVESDGIDLAELARFSGYTHDELTRTVSLESFDWQQYAGDGESKPQRAPGGGEDDAWVTLAYRVPAEVARLFAEQVGRIRRLAGDIPDHMAVEALVAVAMASPDEDFTA